jgi:hypothetical protein
MSGFVGWHLVSLFGRTIVVNYISPPPDGTFCLDVVTALAKRGNNSGNGGDGCADSLG